MYTGSLVFFTVFLKNRNIISKIKRSKVTDYAALSVRKLYWHVLFSFILNIGHYILFAAKICILQLILHGLSINLKGYPHFSATLRYCIPRGYSDSHSTFVYQPIVLRV